LATAPSGTRKQLADHIKNKDFKGVRTALQVIQKDGFKPLKTYEGLQQVWFDKLKHFFIGKIVINGNEVGLVCKMGFSDKMDQSIYVKVLVLTQDKNDFYETTWSLNAIDIYSLNASDFIGIRYFR